MTDWAARLDEIDGLVHAGHYKQAMQDAGGVLEDLLREIYRQTLPSLSPGDQQRISEKAEKIGKSKPVSDFSLGQIVGLFRETELFENAGRALGRKLAHLPSANFNAFVDLRNRATHKNEEVSEEEARYFAAQLRLFARELGLLKTSATPAEQSAGTPRLRPWTELVKLHPDVEAGDLPEAVFAVDLGAIAARDPNVPAVNREPDAFFRATYVTADLGKLLDEVLASLAGKQGYDRVLKLRTPFGGGKSHTLAALLHAARDRQSLNLIPGAKKFADPGPVAVAVFDGEKFDARDAKAVAAGRTVQTMWGWIAWQIDPERCFPLVEGHDRDRVAPGGDVIRQMLTAGAGGRPVLLLLDEVLKYMERAAAVPVLDSTLQRQSKDFFQNLTVEVAGSSNAAMVYSLQWSPREALGNVTLLQEIDKLASRVDQLREPVAGDEILPILQRRLLGAAPPAAAAQEAADAYSEIVTGMKRAYADSPSARKQAEDEGVLMRKRLRAAYPFHPALIDLMKERWTAIDAYQRTRGALRFLATCLRASRHDGGAQALLGPGEIPLRNPDVRLRMLKELGVQNDYDPVITADIEGPNARAKRIDERLARDNPALANVKPATRLATAILAYSFGGLRRSGTTEGDTLPPGVAENELLAACVGPNLDSITATAVLSELRNACLYLHYDGVRYCFKKDPNVTKLVEDAEQDVARNPQEVKDRIREMLERRLAAQRGAVVWQDPPDREPRFLVGYMPLEFAAESRSEQERQATQMFSKCRDDLRRYRNGIGLAVPDRKQIEPLRRAVRYLLAIERVEEKKQQLRLSKDQLDQIKERRRTEEAAAESAFRNLYNAVWLPRPANGTLAIDRVEAGGRPLQATGIHERIMELLTEVGTKKVHGSVTPRKVIERLKLGEPLVSGEASRLGIKASEVLEAFFRDIEPPRLESAGALRAAIAKGVTEGTFGYTSGAFPALGADGKFQVSRDKVAIGRLSEDEVDFDSGFLMVPSAIPEAPTSGSTDAEQKGSGGETGGETKSTVEETETSALSAQRVVRFRFRATRDQVFKAFPAVANLADKSDAKTVTVTVEATAQNGFDKSWLRNAVDEPLDEADVDREE